MNSVQVTFRDFPYSEALETHIYEHVEKIKQFFDHFIHCRVVLSVPQKHKHQGKIFNVRITLLVPGKDIVVTRKENEDIYVAIRDAFDAVMRKLEDYLRRRRGNVKTHDLPLQGSIVRLFPEEGFGFVKGQDDNEYYFSATNVASTTFDRLSVGDVVQFLIESGGDGLQARHITVEKHNHAEST